jgi:SpoVK/Ycf46/Vps4 family AAA+-type ATPase
LVEKSNDFSGAEIEAAVKDGVLEAFIDGDREAKTKDVVKAIESITPTAQMMSEKIEEIRKWARNNIKGINPSTSNNSSLIGSHRRNIEL